MNAVIISIGTELVTGQTVDTNSAWLSQQLAAHGVDVIRHVTVGDDLSRLETCFRHALAAADLVVATGGLGPTEDDLTRSALAAALGAPLKENAEALEQIGAFFAAWQRPMPESNRLQALMPRGTTVIANPRGTAPGIRVDQAGKLLFAFPGVPGEMKPMFEAAVRPEVIARARGAVIRAMRLATFGLSEARVGESIKDLMARGRNPLVGTTASGSIISVRILARGADPNEADALLRADGELVRARLGSVVFGEGEDTLQLATMRLLLTHGSTVATAESCTGGLLGAMLTETPGSSAAYLRGYTTYTNEAKVALLGVERSLLDIEGAVSAPVAEAMARNCRAAAQSDFALSITGIAGPGGGTTEKPVGLVYVGLADARKTAVTQLLLGAHLPRHEIRDRSCKSALNLLRLALLERKGVTAP